MKRRKEVTIAVIIGLIVGLVVVGGVLRARTALENITPPDLPFRNNTNSAQKESNRPSELFLTLDTTDNQVTSNPLFSVQGSTLPDTYIVILSEKSEHIILPNDLGSFTQEVELVTGANTITITSYQEDGTRVAKELTIVYTTAEI